MPLITPDFSESSDAPWQEGIYNARIEGAEVKTSQKGNTYVRWTLSVFGAEGEYAKFNNRKVWHNTMCSGKAAGMLKKFVKAATGEAPAEGKGLDTDALIGREVSLTITQGYDQDGNVSDFPEVKAVNAVQQYLRTTYLVPA